jgi:hypothetical protein
MGFILSLDKAERLNQRKPGAIYDETYFSLCSASLRVTLAHALGKHPG